MNLSEEIISSIDNCVLCWLATCDGSHAPNVSPKELFTHYKDEYIIIANVASPNSVKNIKENPKVCISFVDVIVQKGFQLKGSGVILDNSSEEFSKVEPILTEMAGGKYPFATATMIKIESAKPILAPSYLMYPDMKDEVRMASARKAYGF